MTAAQYNLNGNGGACSPVHPYEHARGGVIRHAILSVAIPCAVLVAAYLAVPRLAELPPGVLGLSVHATGGLLAIAGIISLAFRRGRAAFAVLTLAAAHAAHARYLQPGVPQHVVFAVFAALCLFVPLNLAALSLLRERGTFNRHGLLRLAAIVLEAALAAWTALPGNAATREWLYASPFGHAPWEATAVPQIGLAAIASSAVVAGLVWYRSHAATDFALAASAVAFGIAAFGVTTPHMFGTFIAAGAVVLAIGVLQDTFRMAFDDELTGLPGRRALNERLATLGRRYAIAMLDVDHFKKLNDAHGHDVGDQVLKLAASRIARVRGGGEAYRFGGEEFTVVFPGKDVEEAIPHLESLREELAAYRMEMRHSHRKGAGTPRRRQRAAGPAEHTLSVTVSIGVAAHGGRLSTPEAVLQAADKALYRAKDRGRNRLSR